MQLGHDDLGGRNALALVNVYRDTATVVTHGARTIRIERDADFLGEAGQRLVDGVVHDLVDHVVQARAVVGVADIHAGALAHRIEALQDLDGFRAVIGAFGGCLTGRFGHAKTFESITQRDENLRGGVP